MTLQKISTGNTQHFKWLFLNCNCHCYPQHTKDNSDPIDNVNRSKYLINKVLRISWNNAKTYEVGKIIKSLNNKHSTRYDEIPIKILKLIAPFIISP